MYKIDMKKIREEKDILQCAKDMKEAAKNPLVPGARIIRGADAVPVYVNESACRQWFYPLSEVNDLGMFTYIEKEAKTDNDRAWTIQYHPDVNLYYYILEGSGKVIFGDDNKSFETEVYDFTEQEVVIIPREVPYYMEGEWKAICFHARTGVFGTVAGTNRYPHPVVTVNKPSRPTEAESNNQKEPGNYTCYDQTMTRQLDFGNVSGKRSEYINLENVRSDYTEKSGTYDINDLYAEVTPIDEQTHIISNIKEAKKNATVLGARVLKRKDAPPVYNANAGLRQSSYPLTWTDDIAICNLAEKLASSDEERPFDSHSHPDIEEYKFILSGSGSVTIGVGDETCEEEYYEFKAGDLVILPRGLAHVDAGGYSALYFHAKQSVFGKTPGDSLYPHIAYVYTRPHRPTKEEEEALNDPGTFIKMNSRETYNAYCPCPIERIEKNPTDMTHLRPDLFPETEA